MRRVHLTISGRVQGVYFRQSTKERALEYGVSGWVRNRLDGTVELVAEGESNAVNRLVSWCSVGPKMAVVEGVERIDEEPVGLPPGFDIRPSQ